MIIVFDTETTALLGAEASGAVSQPSIIEFAAIKFNLEGQRIDQVRIVMNPRIPIPDEATRITGYTDEMVKDMKPFAAHWKEIAAFWRDGTVCVGHHLMFDKKVLFWELVRIGKEMNFPWIETDFCTADECSKHFGHRKSLSDLHMHYFGETFTGAHTAIEDANATSRVYFKMRNEPKEETNDGRQAE